MSRYKRPLYERFEKFVEKTDSCWLWKGAITYRGYGHFCIGVGKVVRAHRWLYEYCNGPIPEGLQALHTCDVRNCVNPEHIFIGTNADNQKDGREKGRIRNGPLGQMVSIHNKLTYTD
jgi:hypothetical protein